MKRQEMVNKAVEREVKKRYPTGLAASESGMMMREKMRKEMHAKLTRKNPKLLSY